jgi:hypothetical protein
MTLMTGPWLSLPSSVSLTVAIVDWEENKSMIQDTFTVFGINNGGTLDVASLIGSFVVSLVAFMVVSTVIEKTIYKEIGIAAGDGDSNNDDAESLQKGTVIVEEPKYSSFESEGSKVFSAKNKKKIDQTKKTSLLTAAAKTKTNQGENSRRSVCC